MCRSPATLRALEADGLATGSMSEEVFEKALGLLDSAAEINPSGWGEPYTHPSFPRMLSKIRSTNPRASIAFNTNGLLLGEAEIENLVETRVHHVTISADGARPETYERIRRGARFETLLKTLRLFVSIRARSGSTFPRLCFEFVVMEENVEEMADFVSLAAGFGAEAVTFVNPGPSPPGIVIRRIASLASRLDAYERAKTEAVRSGVFLNGNAVDAFEALLTTPTAASSLDPATSLPARTERRPACLEPFQTISVNCRGEVTPCCVASTMIFGDLAKGSPEEIWNGTPWQALRREFHEGPLTNPVCRNCLMKRLYPSTPAHPLVSS
jgi:MoaA/NifB/PqqE/SkfB family radical SAM enzyme